MSTKTATEIAEELIRDWGPRDLYGVTPDEMAAFLKEEETVIVQKNDDNGDGTFFTQVTFQKNRFACSSTEPL